MDGPTHEVAERYKEYVRSLRPAGRKGGRGGARAGGRTAKGPRSKVSAGGQAAD
jgi:teichoic acid transport system ATP-binding protein